MTLPALISNAVLWPDSKNVFVGPIKFALYSSAIEQQRAANPSLNIGDVAGNTQRAQSFTLAEDTEIWRLQARVSKVGAPSDALTFEIQTDSSGVPSGTVVITGNVTSAGITTILTGSWMNRGVSLATLTGGVRYWFVMKRVGALDASNYFRWAHTTSDVVSGEGRAIHNGTSWATSAGGDHTFRIISTTAGSALYVVLVDKTNNTVECWRSRDGGHTWGEIDPDFHPASMATAGWKTVSSIMVPGSTTSFDTFRPATASSVTRQSIDIVADGWAAVTGAIPANMATSVAGIITLISGPRDAGTHYLAFSGATETIMGTAYRRAKMAYVISDFSTVLDVGSGTTSLPGTQIHYDMRTAVKGSGNRWHAFWTQSDSAQIKARRLTGTTITAAINPASAVVGNQLTNYPIGQPTAYVSGADTWIALPYFDGTDIRVLRCESSIADVAGNWTSEVAVAGVTPEIANADLGCLATEGKKLWLWYVTATTRDIHYVDDGGAGAWTEPATWKEGADVNCDALSVSAMADAIGVVYLDSNTTPARVRYDRLIVFQAKGSQAVGTTTIEYDLGDLPADGNNVQIMLDIGSGADIAGQVDVLIEHRWGAEDAWIEAAQATCYSSQLQDVVPLVGVGRYIQVTSVVTLADSDVGTGGV